MGVAVEVDEARLEQKGDVLHVTTGPAITYWNPANTASGNYTVRASFNEPQYMNLNNHPHPYGIFVAGSGLDGDSPSYLYCAAYGDGRFIVRGFGPEPFQMNGRRGGEAPSVTRAAGPGSPVTQDIAVSVDAENVSCSINGSVVATYPKSEVVGAGKLTSTDGVYGVRFAHKTGTQHQRFCDLGIASVRVGAREEQVVIAACARGSASLAAGERALRDVGAAVTASGLLNMASP